MVKTPGRIEVRKMGSNGNKFTISKGRTLYLIECCGEPCGIDHATKEWRCNDCDNRMPLKGLQAC